MAKLYGANTTARNPAVNTPLAQLDGAYQGGHVRVYREIITLAAQTTADTIVVAYPSKGEQFLYGVLKGSVSLGSSTIAIGVTGTTGKYRASGTHTPTVPTFFGEDAALSAKLTTDEEVFITIGTAALPASGTLTVDLYFAQT